MRNLRCNHRVKHVRTIKNKRRLVDLMSVLRRRLMRTKKNLRTVTLQCERLRDVNEEVVMKLQEEKTRIADLLAEKIQKETEHVQLLTKYMSCKEESERLKKHIVDVNHILSHETVDPLVTLTKSVAALKVRISTSIQSFRNHDDVRSDTSTSAPCFDRHSSPVPFGKDLDGMQNRQAAVNPMVGGFTIQKPTVNLSRVIIPNFSRTPGAPVAVDDSVLMSRRRTARRGQLFRNMEFPSPILEQPAEETENGTPARIRKNRHFEDDVSSTDSSDISDGCIIGNNAAISRTSGMGRRRIKSRLGYIHNINFTDRQAKARATTEVTVPENGDRTTSTIESFTETKEDKSALEKIDEVETSRYETQNSYNSLSPSIVLNKANVGFSSDNNTGSIKEDAHSSVSSSSSPVFTNLGELNVTEPENASVLPDGFVINDVGRCSTHVKPSVSCLKEVEDNSKCSIKESNRKKLKDSRRMSCLFTIDVEGLKRNDLPVNTNTENDWRQPSTSDGDVEPFCGWISSPKKGVLIPDLSVKESTFMCLSASEIEKISKIDSTKEQILPEPTVVMGETSFEPTTVTGETSTIHRRLGRKFFPSFSTQMKSPMSRVNNGATSGGIKEYAATHSELEGETTSCSTIVSSTTNGECEAVENGGDIDDVTIIPEIRLVRVKISDAMASNRFSDSEQLAAETLRQSATFVIGNETNRTEHNNVTKSVEYDISSETVTRSSGCVVADVDEHAPTAMVTTRKKRKIMESPVESNTRNLRKHKSTKECSCCSMNESPETKYLSNASGSSVSTHTNESSSLETRRKNKSSKKDFSTRQNAEKYGEYSRSLDVSFLNGPKDTRSTKSAKYGIPSTVTTRKVKKAEVSSETTPKAKSVAKNTGRNKKQKKNIPDNVIQNDTTGGRRPRRAAAQGKCYAQPSLTMKLRRGID